MKDTKIFLINGYPGAGKDTFVEFCQDFVPVVNIHTSTPAKVALIKLGWDGVTKSPEVRQALALLKGLSSIGFDGVYDYIHDTLEEIKKYHKPQARIVFIHSREPEELERFKQEFGAQTLLIDRKPTEELTNDSDRNVMDYKYDIVIPNRGTVEELKEMAEAFVEIHFLGGK